MQHVGKAFHLGQNIIPGIGGRIHHRAFVIQDAIAPAGLVHGGKGQVIILAAYGDQHYILLPCHHGGGSPGDTFFRTLAQIGDALGNRQRAIRKG